MTLTTRRGIVAAAGFGIMLLGWVSSGQAQTQGAVTFGTWTVYFGGIMFMAALLTLLLAPAPPQPESPEEVAEDRPAEGAASE